MPGTAPNLKMAGGTSPGAAAPAFGLNSVPMWKEWHIKLKRLLQQQLPAASGQTREQLTSHFASMLIDASRELVDEFSRRGREQQSAADSASGDSAAYGDSAASGDSAAGGSGRVDRFSGAATAEQMNALALLVCATMFDMALAQQAATL